MGMTIQGKDIGIPPIQVKIFACAIVKRHTRCRRRLAAAQASQKK